VSDEIHHFFQYGAQYYLTGRFAAFSGQTPVVGNLMHHAVEMFLKGSLSKSMTLPEMKKKLGHKLPGTWQVFKVGANDKSLDKFDATVDMLDAFEDIRYPDEIIAKGAALQIDIRKATAVIPQFAGGYNPPHYMFSLEEIDELVAAIFKVASRNPSAYFHFMKEDARRYLNLDNNSFNA